MVSSAMARWVVHFPPMMLIKPLAASISITSSRAIFLVSPPSPALTSGRAPATPVSGPTSGAAATPTTPPATSAPAAAPAASGAPTGTLRYANADFSNESMDPINLESVWGFAMYDSLLTFDQQGNVVGNLAENYSLSDDGLTWTFKI